jgi:methylglyoxal synthase
MATVAHEIDARGGVSRRLAHQIDLTATRPDGADQSQTQVAGAQPATRRPALALTAEGPRRADLIAWATSHAPTLRGMRLLAPAAVGTLLARHLGLSAEPLCSGTVGPAAPAGLAAAGELDAMIAFTDPIELRPGDTTTRSLTRLAVFWDIPMAGNRATADLLLAAIASDHLAVSPTERRYGRPRATA